MPIADVIVDDAQVNKNNLRRVLASQETVSITDPKWAESTAGALDGGAVGDGVTDSTDAIDDARAASPDVWVPQGTFLYAAEMDLSEPWQSRFSLRGVPEFSIIELTDDAARLKSYALEIDELDDDHFVRTIEGLTIRGNWTLADGTSANTRGLQIGRYQDLLDEVIEEGEIYSQTTLALSKLRLVNHYVGAWFDSGQEVWLKETIIRDCAYGVLVDGLANNASGIKDGCHIRACSEAGIKMEPRHSGDTGWINFSIVDTVVEGNYGHGHYVKDGGYFSAVRVWYELNGGLTEYDILTEGTSVGGWSGCTFGMNVVPGTWAGKYKFGGSQHNFTNLCVWPFAASALVELTFASAGSIDGCWMQLSGNALLHPLIRLLGSNVMRVKDTRMTKSVNFQSAADHFTAAAVGTGEWEFNGGNDWSECGREDNVGGDVHKGAGFGARITKRFRSILYPKNLNADLSFESGVSYLVASAANAPTISQDAAPFLGSNSARINWTANDGAIDNNAAKFGGSDITLADGDFILASFVVTSSVAGRDLRLQFSNTNVRGIVRMWTEAGWVRYLGMFRNQSGASRAGRLQLYAANGSAGAYTTWMDMLMVVQTSDNNVVNEVAGGAVN